MRAFVVLIHFWFMLECCLGSGVTEEQSLKTFLDGQLTKTTPPLDIENQSIYIDVDLFQILSVDEKDGHLLLKLYVYYYYLVPSAKWDPATYGGITVIQVPADTYWVPDIVPWEANEIKYEGNKKQVIFADTDSAVVSSWSSVITMQVSCSFQIADFPFDEQHCPIRFGSWQFPLGVYYLDQNEVYPQEADLQDFEDHDEWSLVRPLKILKEKRKWEDDDRDVIVLDIHLKRLPLFYTMIWVVPVIVLYILTGLVFLIPVEAGEKISFVITLLLAQVVNLGTLATFLPATSRNFPLLGFFIIIVVIQVSLIAVLTVFVINVHNIGGKMKMGYRWRSIISSKRMWVFGLRPCPMEKAFPGLEDTKDGSGSKKDQGWVASEAKETDPKRLPNGAIEQEKSLRKVVENALDLEDEENTAFLWEYCSRFFDRVFLYLHLVITFPVLIGFMIYFVQ